MKIDNRIFLFSIDLENLLHPELDTPSERIRFPKIVERYLKLLNDRNSKCTFFTLGRIIEKYPTLISDIYKEGHEIACHSFNHTSLTNQSEDEFRYDLSRNIESILKIGASDPVGYRAPYLSLNEKTKWVYKVLKEYNFAYSSSVLPARNPQYGWKGFDKQATIIDGITEIPISVAKFFITDIPFAGGAYFKLLPEIYLEKLFNSYLLNSNYIVGYFHPYDIDYEQPKVHLETPRKLPFDNFILYAKRKGLQAKIETIIDKFKLKVITYKDFHLMHGG